MTRIELENALAEAVNRQIEIRKRIDNPLTRAENLQLLDELQEVSRNIGRLDTMLGRQI